MQMKDYLYEKDFHELLSRVKLKDRQVLGLFQLMLSKNVAFNIIKEKTTSNMLKAL